MFFEFFFLLEILIKALKETQTQVFSSEFCESFKNTFFTEHFRATASVFILMLM